MEHERNVTAPTQATRDVTGGRYERPRFEVIALDCEITAYAPDGNDPLF
jgi:hypothetical protein